MIDRKKILALIPARGGSKGIKNKNIKHVGGKPLICHTIDQAKKSKYIDSVVVSTDTEKIRSIALKSGARVPFIRPKKLATDTAKTVHVVTHALEMLKELGEMYDVLILLQPTQPLRSVRDIDNALELFVEKKGKSVVSVCEAHNLLLMRKIKKNGLVLSVQDRPSDVRRQDMENFYVVNGAIYINKVSDISDSTSFNDNAIAYIMPKSRSVDIDEDFDLFLADLLISKGK